MALSSQIEWYANWGVQVVTWHWPQGCDIDLDADLYRTKGASFDLAWWEDYIGAWILALQHRLLELWAKKQTLTFGALTWPLTYGSLFSALHELDKKTWFFLLFGIVQHVLGQCSAPNAPAQGVFEYTLCTYLTPLCLSWGPGLCSGTLYAAFERP